MKRALETCYRHLGRRDHTVAQLRRRLDRAGTEPEVAEQALAIVASHGYLDDAGFAERFVTDRRTLDGWGTERIRERLETAGVARELIDSVLSDRTRGDELAAALELLRRRLVGPPRTDAERNRALGLLLRRGYEPELAYDAVRTAEREPD